MAQEQHSQEEQEPATEFSAVREEVQAHPDVAKPESNQSGRNTDDAEERAVLQAMQKSTVRSNWLIAGATVIMTVTGILQSCFMLESNKLTTTSNDLTRQSVEATERALKLTEESNRLTREGISESRRLSEAGLAQSKADSEASQRIAREALEDSRSSIRESQRARLVIDEVGYSLDQPGTLSAFAVVKNTGLAAAERVRWYSSIELGKDSSYIQTAPMVPWEGFQPLTVIGGGVTLRFGSEATVDHGNITAATPMFYGRVEYFDGFRVSRSLGFCYYYGVIDGRKDGSRIYGWSPCYYHNWIDEEPVIYQLARDPDNKDLIRRITEESRRLEQEYKKARGKEPDWSKPP